jgi:hypothetical protein
MERFEPVTPIPPSSLARRSPFPDDDRIATPQPSVASLRATAAPMPLPAAVMSAILFVGIVYRLRSRRPT